MIGVTPVLAQSISSFFPVISQVGVQVQVQGSGFVAGVTKIYFNGVIAVTTVTAGNLCFATVPAGATTGLMSVANPPGAQSYGGTYTVIGPEPYITNFTPQVGSGGILVTIQGVQFQTNVTSVKFAGINASNFFVQSVNTILATNRPDVATGPITVSGPGGTMTTSNYFYAIPIVISSFAPGTGAAGSNVVITGQNFLGTTNVQFSGVNSPSFTAATNTQITATVPSGISSGKIMVATPGGIQFSSTNFRILPTISGFSPATGGPSTSVTITGANLNEGTPTVQFNGTTATLSGSPTFSQVTAVVPGGATTGPITVTTTNGTTSSVTNFYLPPSITSFTPTNSAPGTSVRITGNNLTNASAVSFNGLPAQTFNVTNNTTIGAVVPGGILTGPISVTTPGGSATNGLFYGPPGITLFSPTHGLPGTNVTLTGSNFLGAIKVLFNGTNASFTPPANNTNLVATVPNGAQTGPLTVIGPAGTNTTAASFFLDYSNELSVTVTALPDPVAVGSNVVYSISLYNNSQFSAPNVMFTNTLPDLVILKAASPAGNLNTNGNPITGTFSSIGAFNGVQVILTVTPQSGGLITNVASAWGGYPDPVPGNNTAVSVTTVLPQLRAFRTQSNTVVVGWPAPSTGFTLQQNSALGTTNWAPVTNVPSTVSVTNAVTASEKEVIIIPKTNSSYRLKYP